MKIADSIRIEDLTTLDSCLYFIDASVSIYRDISGNLYLSDKYNSPIKLIDFPTNANNIRATYVPDASLSTGFYWNSGLLYVDVSVVAGGVTQLYVDTADNSIKAAYIPDVSLNPSYFRWNGGYLEPSIASGTGDVTKDYVDGSLAFRDTSIFNLDVSVQTLYITKTDFDYVDASFGKRDYILSFR